MKPPKRPPGAASRQGSGRAEPDDTGPRGAFTAPPKRNPLVAAALLRKAGAHRKSNKALRRGRRSRDDGESSGN